MSQYHRLALTLFALALVLVEAHAAPPPGELTLEPTSPAAQAARGSGPPAGLASSCS
jgi:hypothetical protein